VPVGLGRSSIPEIYLLRRMSQVEALDIDEKGRKALQMAYELQPSSYEELMAKAWGRSAFY